jgi:hypothetical protein
MGLFVTANKEASWQQSRIKRKGKEICNEEVFVTCLLVLLHLLLALRRFLSVHQSEI